MLRAVLFPLLLLLLAQTASAQCTKKLSELPAAPELLGFRLGMTKEQIKARVPQTTFGKADHFGVTKTTINPYFDPKIDKTQFEGVRSISLDLVDDRLTSLWIGFDETFKVHTAEEFVKLISHSLGVDGNWSSWRSKGQQLRCADFQLIVTTVAGGPSFRLLDTAAEDLVAERRQAKEEQDAMASRESTEATTEIVGDKQSKTYYSDGCPPSKEIVEKNKVVFKTVEEAEKAGFKAAKNCH
jgi:Metal binding domain of Ada